MTTNDPKIAAALLEFEMEPATGDGVHDPRDPIDSHAAALGLLSAATQLEAGTRMIAPPAVVRQQAKDHAVAALRFLKHCR